MVKRGRGWNPDSFYWLLSARLDRLLKKAASLGRRLKSIPQGLKPAAFLDLVSARLKSCPVTEHGYDSMQEKARGWRAFVSCTR
jgi:hypothetical protein